MVDSGKFENEWYIAHFNISDDVFVISDKHVVLISTITTTLSSKWNFSLKSIAKVDKTVDSIIFILRSGRKYMLESIDQPHLLSNMYQIIIDTVSSIDKRISIY